MLSCGADGILIALICFSTCVHTSYDSYLYLTGIDEKAPERPTLQQLKQLNSSRLTDCSPKYRYWNMQTTFVICSDHRTTARLFWFVIFFSIHTFVLFVFSLHTVSYVKSCYTMTFFELLSINYLMLQLFASPLVAYEYIGAATTTAPNRMCTSGNEPVCFLHRKRCSDHR
jgi:hypothetical protein